MAGHAAASDYYDLGSFHRKITTTSPDAQRWFDRGLVWNYAFNHDEAAHCFEQAILCDADCAMAYWGLAYVLGPNYNKPWAFFSAAELAATLRRARAVVRLAQRKAEHAPCAAVERALVAAVGARYQEREGEGDGESPGREELAAWHREYVKAMERVHAEFGGDLDVAALFADALMNLTPWRLWDLRSGLPAKGARTLDIKRVIDAAMTQDEALAHPGLLHLNIHLMEMSSTPEVALPLANHLRDLVPDSGHLIHMPSHLDIICGDYSRAIISNTAATHADSLYLARAGALNFYTLYRCHNYHFLIYAAMFCGASQVALATSAGLTNVITEEMLRIQQPPMADWLEGFAGTRFHALVRFGKWKEILELEFPHDKALYCVTTAMLHYAKGIAFASTNRVTEAEEQRKLFGEARKRVPPSRSLFNNKCVDILKVAALMLDGEVAYRRGSYDEAFDKLGLAVETDDALPFDEPWGWMQPTRHALGALLLEQGHVERALDIYKADLGVDESLPRVLRHPNNVWSLHGYHECLVRLGRKEEAAAVEPKLEEALGRADVPIRSSCFCRIGEKNAEKSRIKPSL